jgi:hypothetical protein
LTYGDLENIISLMNDSRDILKADEMIDPAGQKIQEEISASNIQSTIPEPASNSAVKEALDVAQSVGRQKSKIDVENFGVGGLDDSVSLYEYIDDAERRSQAWFESPASDGRPPIEDLDVLNIAAEFGRPDEIADDADNEYVEMRSGIDGSYEDTKNIKLPSVVPIQPVQDPLGVPEQAELPQEILNIDIDPEANKYSSSSLENAPRILELDADEHSGRSQIVRRGRLETLRFWQLLHGVYQSQFRGICMLRSMGETRTLLIQDGDVISAATTSIKKDFLSWMEQERYLRKEDVIEVRKKASEMPTVSIRELLLQSGLIRINAINRLERLHYERLTMEAMGWTSGDWRLEAVSFLKDLPISPIETPMPALIFRGLVDYAGAADVERFQANGSLMLKALGPPDVSLAELLLFDDETAFVRAIREETRLEDAASHSHLGIEKAYRITAALSMLGFVTTRETDLGRHVEQYKNAESTDQSPTLSPSVALEDEIDEALTLKAKLAVKCKNVEKGTYFEILDLEPCVDSAAIGAAKDRLLGIFDMRRFSKAGLSQSEEQVNRIRDAVLEAFLVLSDPARCQSYAAAILDMKTRHA